MPCLTGTPPRMESVSDQETLICLYHEEAQHVTRFLRLESINMASCLFAVRVFSAFPTAIVISLKCAINAFELLNEKYLRHKTRPSQELKRKLMHHLSVSVHCRPRTPNVCRRKIKYPRPTADDVIMVVLAFPSRPRQGNDSIWLG